MTGKKRLRRIAWGVSVLLFLGAGFFHSSVLADDALVASQMVEKARLTFQAFVGDPNMAAFVGLIKKARGVLISPQVLKGAFVIGASGGSGVFLARQSASDPWAGPAFYTIGEVSFGLQIGGEASEIILLAMTERGVTAFLDNSFKLGANAGLAAGPVGAGASAASANLSADILSFSRSKGLYGGISLDGAVVAVRNSWNDAYYRKIVRPVDILISRTVTNPEASGLISAVAKTAGP